MVQSGFLSRLRERGTTRSVVERGATCTELVLRSPEFIRDRAKVLRRAMTGPERTLWALLRHNQQGLHFRRQHPVGPFVLDFYCPTAKLCGEIDGPVHVDRVAQDARRTEWLWSKAQIRVVRFTTEEIERRPAVVLAAIAQAAPRPPPNGGPPPPQAGEVRRLRTFESATPLRPDNTPTAPPPPWS